MSDEDLWLIRFTSDYYHHPIGEVVAAALPGLLRNGKSLHPMIEKVAVTQLAAHTDIETLRRRAPRQAELLEALLDAGGDGLDTAALNETLPNWRRATKGLLDKGVIEFFESRAEEFDESILDEPQPGPTLNKDQLTALAMLRSSDRFERLSAGRCHWQRQDRSLSAALARCIGQRQASAGAGPRDWPDATARFAPSKSLGHRARFAALRAFGQRPPRQHGAPPHPAQPI